MLVLLSTVSTTVWDVSVCRVVSGADTTTVDLLQYRNFKLVGVGIMPGNIIVTQIFK